jgi:hypothetical protein
MHVFSDFNKDLTKEFGVLITAKESEHYKVRIFLKFFIFFNLNDKQFNIEFCRLLRKMIILLLLKTRRLFTLILLTGQQDEPACAVRVEREGGDRVLLEGRGGGTLRPPWYNPPSTHTQTHTFSPPPQYPHT